MEILQYFWRISKNIGEFFGESSKKLENFLENILDPILAPDLNFRPWKIALSVWEIKQSPKFRTSLTVEMIANLEPGNQLTNVDSCSLECFHTELAC